MKKVSSVLIALSAVAVVAVPSFAHAAYICELYDRAPNAPGGDIPVAVLFSNTTDAGAAKSACSGKVDRRSVIDYWLKFTEESKLPADWKKSDLFAGAATPSLPAPVPSPAPNLTPVPAPANNQGYACIVYDKPASAPLGDIPLKVVYSNVLKVDAVEKKCIALMRASLPGVYQDYEVRYLENLPKNWEKSLLVVD